MVTENEALKVAKRWIEACNSGDLDAVMECYADDVVYTLPPGFPAEGNRAGTIRGKEALRRHLGKTFTAFPNLRLELLRVFCGGVSLVIHYCSLHGSVVADVMMLNTQGKANMVMSHRGVEPS